MKALRLLLAAASLAVGAAQARTVVLTPDQVVNGIEINAAMDAATHHGTEPGRVVFDGRGTGFTCAINEDNPDVSKLTHIRYSNLQLVGINGADTGAGICNVLFADAHLENILIEGLKIANFIEEGTGISAPGLSVRRNVTIRKNDISGAIALQAFNPTGWKIYGNTIGRARDEVVTLIGAQETEFIGNAVTGFPGLLLLPSQTRESTGNRLIANRFSSSNSIELRGASARNLVALNTGECPVVILGAATTQNKVLFNRAPRASCGAGGPVVDLGSDNKVVGNQP